MKKISEMIIAVGGDLISQVDSLEEMRAHLELVKIAWNMSLYSEKKRKGKLKIFIESQRRYAPNPEALEGLRWEFLRMMKQKNKLFPEIKNKIEKLEAFEASKDDYIIRAYSTTGNEYF